MNRLLVVGLLAFVISARLVRLDAGADSTSSGSDKNVLWPAPLSAARWRIGRSFSPPLTFMGPRMARGESDVSDELAEALADAIVRDLVRHRLLGSRMVPPVQKSQPEEAVLDSDEDDSVVAMPWRRGGNLNKNFIRYGRAPETGNANNR